MEALKFKIKVGLRYVLGNRMSPIKQQMLRGDLQLDFSDWSNGIIEVDESGIKVKGDLCDNEVKYAKYKVEEVLHKIGYKLVDNTK